jgi:hypothetical protein
MNKITILGAAAALTFGLACGASGQKKGVEFKGPPVSDKDKPKPETKQPAQQTDAGQTPANDGPQSGQAAGFGVGQPGRAPAGQPASPPLRNPPDTMLPPIGEPVETKDEKAEQPKPEAETKQGAATQPPAVNADTAATKSLAPNRKAKRPRRVKKG